MKYFELYGIPASFQPDTGLIRKKYLELGREFHPDFYTLETPEKQKEMLALAELNNRAFRTLSDFDLRMKYILMEKGYVEEEEKYALPQVFLMEMMELNEMVEGLPDTDAQSKEDVMQRIDALENAMYEEVRPLLEGYSEENTGGEVYNAIKDYYYKRKYLLRMRSQMDKFAG